MNIGVIGDFNQQNPTHVATNLAIKAAGPCLVDWLATDEAQDYNRFAGLVAGPGSPYRSEAGALEGIRFARENDIPLLGTCGGFQHLILEFARNVAKVPEAAHAENDPYASVLFITRLACSLAGKTMTVSLDPGTLARGAYKSDRVAENYYCNFGLNPEYLDLLVQAGLLVSGRDDNGEVRIVELPGHPFFVGTLFVPQTRLKHPLIEEFYKSAMDRHKR